MAMNMAPRSRLVRLHVRPTTWHCHARALSAHGAPVSPDRGGPRPESRAPGTAALNGAVSAAESSRLRVKNPPQKPIC